MLRLRWIRRCAPLLTAAAWLAVAPSAQTALIEGDVHTKGDGLRTVDTETGLEWLDLTESTNLSHIQVRDGIGNDLIAQGWRFSSAAELCTLYEHAGYPFFPFPCPRQVSTFVELPGRIPLLDLMGQTLDDGRLSGYGTTALEPGGLGYAYYRYSPVADTTQMLIQQPTITPQNTPVAFRGHFLVREAPAPGSLTLGLTVIAALARLRERRRSSGRNAPAHVSSR